MKILLMRIGDERVLIRSLLPQISENGKILKEYEEFTLHIFGSIYDQGLKTTL